MTFQVSAGVTLKICSEDHINDMTQYFGLKCDYFSIFAAFHWQKLDTLRILLCNGISANCESGCEVTLF
jgi:hypothetical protein